MRTFTRHKRLDRRSFLQLTMAGGAGVALAPKSFRLITGSHTNDLNVALLGAGVQGQVLLNSCLKIPGVRFTALCDIWTAYNQKYASAYLKEYGHAHNTYEDYRDMLATEQDLDAVIIATPDFWHEEQTVACLKAGLHVYCEKEMSTTLTGARHMVQAARDTGKLLQIGHQRRSNPRYLHCYEKLLKNAKLLGRMTTIGGQWNRSYHPDRGWPKKAVMEQEKLAKYGYESMHQFKNWRWYKGLGGGPIVDLGSHQIDIFNWFLEATPTCVLANGGTNYYDQENHEWYDNVFAIYDYETPDGIVRGTYQTITTNSCQGYFELFLGDEGTLVLSESAGRGDVYPEPSAPGWGSWVELGYLNAPRQAEDSRTSAVTDVRETVPTARYTLPVEFTDPYHKPHLENFFNAVRGQTNLTCPAEIGYETAVSVLKVNDAVEAGQPLYFTAEDFQV